MSAATVGCALAALVGLLCGALLSWFGMRRWSSAPTTGGREVVSADGVAVDDRPEIGDSEFDPEWFVIEDIGPIETRLAVHVPFDVPAKDVGAVLCGAVEGFANRDATVPVRWTFASDFERGLGFDLRCSLRESAAPDDLVAELRSALAGAGMPDVAVDRYL